MERGGEGLRVAWRVPGAGASVSACPGLGYPAPLRAASAARGRVLEEGVVKVIVDYDLCEANAVCMDVCPEVFKVDEDDNLHILMEEIPEELRPKVEEAVRLCPRQALRIE